MGTDQDWVKWGQQDPYFAVITNDKYRTGNLNDAARQEFFDSGQHHVHYVLDACRRIAGAGFSPARALDFGCGVGRVTLALAGQAGSVLGLDVSPNMLVEAQRNAEQVGLLNVDFLLSGDDLSTLPVDFDLVHSCITFQHIDIARGRSLFHQLVARLAPGGVGAIQITYGKTRHSETFGQPPAPAAVDPMPPPAPPLTRSLLGRISDVLKPASDPAPEADPEMQMNSYSLGELAFILQQAGVLSFQAEFTDHGGELGVFLFFKKP